MAIELKTETSSSVTTPASGGISLYVDVDNQKVGFKNSEGSVKYFAEAQIGKRLDINSTSINFSTASIQVLNLTASSTLSISNYNINQSITLEVSSSNSALLTIPTEQFAIVTGSYLTNGSKNYIRLTCINETTPLFLTKILQEVT